MPSNKLKMEPLFGTNGIRGVVNERFSAEFAVKIGMAIGTFARGGKAVIGTDGRTSNEMIRGALIAGLVSTGSNVTDLGIVPTPVLQFAVPRFGARIGLTVTASHNPPEFNGIKCADRDGAELMRPDEEKIERIYYTGKFARCNWDRLGIIVQGSIIPEYIDRLVSFVNVRATKKACLRVVMDCGNGTTGLVTPIILKRLGCRVVTINADVDGKFPSHPSEPTRENASQLVSAVRSNGADLGIIQDGDGDRTIFVDEKGEYISGDRSMAMIADSITKEMKRGGTVVTPVNSSKCVEDVVCRNGCRLIYTRVGSPSVIGGMKKSGAFFGGEEAGGLVYPEFQYAKDGMMTAAKMVEILAKRHIPMSQLAAEIPEYHVHKVRVKCDDAKKAKVLRLFRKEMERKGLKADSTDGVKISFPGGWVLVRPSGTEPIFRVFTETRSQTESERISREYIATLESLILQC